MNLAQQRLTGTDRAMKAYQLAARGMSQIQIAEELHISRSAVVRAIQRGQRLALDDFKQETAGQIVAQLARLDGVYNQALASFAESRHPAARKRSSHRTGRGGDEARTASVDVQDSSPGNPRFLGTALTAVAGIRRLLGLDARQRLQIDTPPDAKPHGDKTDEQIHQELADLFKQTGLDPKIFNS